MRARTIAIVIAMGFFVSLVCSLAVLQAEPQPMELNDTEWDITLVKGGDQATATPDILIFTDGKFSSEYFAAEGYSPTNYTPSLKDDGETTIFETMQSKDSGDLGFWRGEISGTILKGVISFRLPDGSAGEKYNFIGSLASGELKEKIPYQPPVPPPAPVVEETPAPPAVAKERAVPAAGKGEATQGKEKSLWQRITGSEE